MAEHCPDFSSSEDEFDDPDFKELMRQRRLERNQIFNGNLNAKQQKEQKIKKIQNDVIQRNNEEVIKAINEVVDLNEKLHDEWTLISLAASVGNYNLVVKLCEMGADISLKKGGDTILMCACNCPSSKAPEEELLEVIKYLIDKGVDVNAKNRKRMNALMIAASNGNQSAVEFLISFFDINEEDNQGWDVLFWAVYSGNASLVEFLLDEGMSIDRVDIRGNKALDIAIDNNYKDIITLLMPEEEDNENYILETHIDFIDIFKNLQYKEKPFFMDDVHNFLHGARCENLIKLFAVSKVSLLKLLSSSEEELEDLGVSMPFQRRRLKCGLYRFHKAPFQPSSIPFVGKDQFYSNIDIAAAVLSCVKQLICMEAALKFIEKNVDNHKIFNENLEVEKTLGIIETKLGRLKKTLKKLQIKAVEWDNQIKPVNIITANSGKRWFPWRKTLVLCSTAIVLSFKLWNKSTISVF